jgi:hypothetical protein
MKLAMKKATGLYILLGLTIIFLALVGCTNGGNGEATTSEAPNGTQRTADPTPTSTTAPPKLVLWAGPEVDQALFAMIQPVAAQYAADSGFVFEHRQSLTAEMGQMNLRVVVVLPPAPGLDTLLLNLPETRFVAVGINGLPQTANLTVINAGGKQATFQGFTAGYIAAMQTKEWRVGIISRADEAGRLYLESFLNGVIYFCGFCNPIYPPYWEYPLYYEVESGANEIIWQKAADDLIGQGVTTFHVAPGVGDERLISYLAERGVLMVGTSAPPEGAMGNWIASVELDILTSFREAMDVAVGGGVMGQVITPLKITNVNLNNFSQGRLAHVDLIIEQLEDGVIDPVGE